MTDIDASNLFSPPRAALAEPGTSTGGPVFAGRGTRLGAAILDSILVSVIAAPFYYAVGNLGVFSGQHGTPGMAMFVLALLPGYALAAVIQSWFFYTGGQTIGKKLLKIRIVRKDGSRAGLVRLLVVRAGSTFVMVFIPVLGGLISLVDSLVIFRASHQCLHDQIADTIVVTAPSSMNATLAATKRAIR